MNTIFYGIYTIMIPYILCKTCGCQVDFYEIYIIRSMAKKAELMAKYQITGDNLAIAALEDQEFGKILDDLGITCECCRTSTMTSMNRSDYI